MLQYVFGLNYLHFFSHIKPDENFSKTHTMCCIAEDRVDCSVEDLSCSCCITGFGFDICLSLRLSRSWLLLLRLQLDLWFG